MRIKRHCLICGSEYWTGNGKSKYCSDACRREATRKRQKQWRDEHPEYHKQYFKEHPETKEKFKERHPNYDRDRWREARKSQEYTRKCIVCGQSFTTWIPHKKTCSVECREQARRARRQNRRRTPEEEHLYWVKRKYGSEEAYREYLAERERQRQEQKEQTRRRREAEKQARIIHGKCVVCGNTFETFNPIQKTCCKACGKKLQYARKDHRIPKNQIVDKDITLEALYRRDSGVCYLCGKPCDWDDKSNNAVGMNYPSIDHIIPVSRGGLHAWDNVRLAHFGCNLRKKNDLFPDAEQLIQNDAYSVKREPVDQRKQTLQYSRDGELIAVYASTADAERKTGIKQRGIQNCARGECEAYRGYVWRYA